MSMFVIITIDWLVGSETAALFLVSYLVMVITPAKSIFSN